MKIYLAGQGGVDRETFLKKKRCRRLISFYAILNPGPCGMTEVFRSGMLGFVSDLGGMNENLFGRGHWSQKRKDVIETSI